MKKEETTKELEGRFYGFDSVTPEIRQLFEDFLHVWAADTCAPRMREQWTKENPTLGHCSITSFIVQDLLGGKVYGIPLEEGGVHCYNEVNGMVFDLASEQFGDIILNYEGNPEQFRESHFSDPDKRDRYELLKMRLENYRSYKNSVDR